MEPIFSMWYGAVNVSSVFSGLPESDAPPHPARILTGVEIAQRDEVLLVPLRFRVDFSGDSRLITL